MKTMLDPDIGGQMTEGIMRASEKLRCKCCFNSTKSLIMVDKDGENFDQVIHPNLENMTIILEISKYFGKEMNLVITYEIFKKINSKAVKRDSKKPFDIQEIRNMFIVALQNLKYMGYVTASRSNTFLFKKNYFGKPILAQKLLSQQEKEAIAKKENQENIKNLFNAKRAEDV